MSDVTLSEELARINGLVRDELVGYRRRVGEFAFALRHEQMGRSIVLTFWRDGVEDEGKPNLTLSPYVKAAYRLEGRTPFVVDLAVDAHGVPGEPVLEFDRPPAAIELRRPSLYVQELELRPRPPALVPGWMKVELAAIGAWDLRADCPAWADFEPTAQPQTPESAGVPPPSGAEWALVT